MRYPFIPVAIRRALKPHPQVPHPWSRYSAKDRLDRKLEKYLNFDGGFFVELGAGDGLHLTNTLYFEKYRNWRGILVDPALTNALSCLENRKRSKTFLAAGVSNQFKDKYVDLIYAGYMTSTLGVESDITDIKEHILGALPYLPTRTVGLKFPAYARTLQSILLEASAPKIIDLLSLDTEGSEIEVLKGLDFEKYKFKFILIESRSPNKAQEFLLRKGYKYIEKLGSADYLFRLDPPSI